MPQAAAQAQAAAQPQGGLQAAMMGEPQQEPQLQVAVAANPEALETELGASYNLAPLSGTAPANPGMMAGGAAGLGLLLAWVVMRLARTGRAPAVARQGAIDAPRDDPAARRRRSRARREADLEDE